jgi:hypothetical protein
VPNSVFCARRLSPLVRLLAVAEPATWNGSRRGAWLGFPDCGSRLGGGLVVVTFSC